MNVWLVLLGLLYIVSGKTLSLILFSHFSFSRKKYTTLGHQWDNWRAQSFSQGTNILSPISLPQVIIGKKDKICHVQDIASLYSTADTITCFVVAIMFLAHDLRKMWLWNPVQRERGPTWILSASIFSLFLCPPSYYLWDEGFDSIYFFQRGFCICYQCRPFSNYPEHVRNTDGFFG